MISRKRTGELIVDAGLKALSTDDGFAVVTGDPDATYEPAGDEHGRVRGVAARARIASGSCRAIATRPSTSTTATSFSGTAASSAKYRSQRADESNERLLDAPNVKV